MRLLFQRRSENPGAEIYAVLAPGGHGDRLWRPHGNAIHELQRSDACRELRAVAELFEAFPLPLAGANALVRGARQEVGKLPCFPVNHCLAFFAQYAGTGNKSILADALPGDGAERCKLFHALCRQLG